MTESSGRSLREAIGHPVIDTDGHLVEFMPVFEEYLAEHAGVAAVEHYRRGKEWFRLNDDERRLKHLAKVPWGYPVDPHDHMASMLPALLEERLLAMGIDFVVIHPSPKRLGIPHYQDADLRHGMCRAMNAYMADLLRPHGAHMTPAAIIPMYSPTEAIEHLEFAVGELGMKATMVASHAQRPVGAPQDAGVPGAERALWWDNFVLDSLHDYDPVWAKFQELRVVPSFHSGTIGMGSRILSTNSIYNFIGHFEASQESICKALFLGGVTRRFPDLKFCFETAGVAWAALLYANLVAQWSIRRPSVLFKNDPAQFDLEVATKLFSEHAPEHFRSHSSRLSSITDRMTWLDEEDLAAQGDEYALAGIEQLSDFESGFVDNFFFGCLGEATFDHLAFEEANFPSSSKLKAVYGTDMGHYNPTPMDEMLGSAHEAVDQERISPDDFRAMTFANPVELFAGTNPDFFRGTAIEKEVQEELQDQMP
jgi:predicted TIM-barrel fold metal-dependent hydrolase